MNVSPRVLLILGHPREQSLCGALFDAFRGGLTEAGVDFREIHVADLRFDPDVRVPSPEDQALEPDLQAAQALISWANHSLLLFFAILPSIILSGLPDFEADGTAGKSTLVVKMGKRRALDMAMLACAVAAAIAVGGQLLDQF